MKLRDLPEPMRDAIDRVNRVALGPPIDRVVLTEILGELVMLFGDANRDEQAAMRRALSRSVLDTLVGFARQMSRDTVSMKAPELLEHGLTALAIVRDGNDFRDTAIARQELVAAAARLKGA